MRGLAVWLFAVTPALANLDTIGVTALRHCDPTLTGTGVPVAQVEASAPGWQANPSMSPQMTWTCMQGSTTNFPNTLGAESWHANEVGRLFFSTACGVAPAVTQMDNYEFSYFTGHIIPNQIPIAAKVVNQSFAYFSRSTRVDQEYDNYAARYNVLFVSGAGNGGAPKSPGTAYNGLSVAAYGGLSSFGPSTDQRSKPDITAPGTHTSYSTPLVSGAAALLHQAGVTDIRLLKALLLNGAQKPPYWTNSATAPLDHRYGAGVLNVFNSWRQLRGGRYSDLTARRGWDIATGTRRYLFDARAGTLTATLIWLRQSGCSNINNLDLSLLTESGELLAASTSTVDNVEHLHLPALPAGRYLLEVSGAADETYALAFDFGPSQPPRFDGWTLTGEPNQRYVIQSTTDLCTWTPFLTNSTSAFGSFDFNPQYDGASRFFRALELP